MNSEKLLKIYTVVTKHKNMLKYPPVRKNYNVHLYG